MADPIDPIREPSGTSDKGKIEPTRNDPTPEERTGDSRFLPVVILAGIVLILLLIAGIVLVKGKGHKMVPQQPDSHPTSSLVQPASSTDC